MITKPTNASSLALRPRIPAVIANRVQGISSSEESTFLIIVFIGLHIPLALLMEAFPNFAAAHALLIFLIGVLLAFRSPVDSPRPLYIIGYLVGAEVLWRATGAARILSVEQVRYVSMVMIAIMFLRHRKQQIPFFPILYVCLLLPSLINYIGYDVVFLRFWAVSALIGPIATGVFSIFLYKRALDSKTLSTLGFFVIAPLVGTATLVFLNLATLDVTFTAGSNEIASGFGANQVSNALAMGVMFCWLLLIKQNIKLTSRAVILIIMIGLTVPMLFTFSRSGPWTIAIIVMITSLLMMVLSPYRIWAFFIVMIFALILMWLIPWFNTVTSGAFIQRYTDTSGSGREELAQSEFAIWLENPLFGIGPGMARERVDDYYSRTELQTHVEYTRVLAEHGMLGLVAMLVLIVSGANNFFKADQWQSKIWIAAFLLFTFAFIGNSSYRITVPSFLYALTWANLFSPLQQDTGSPGKSDYARFVRN
jgi:hypothetical protein